MKLISFSIDLTKIDAERIVEHENGSRYCHFVIEERKEVGTYGDTHMVYEKQTKEERTDKIARNFVGNGKEFVFEDNANTANLPPKAAPPKKAAQKKKGLGI